MKHHKKIAAFTMVELIVVLIVSGILLLTAYETILAVKKYTQRMSIGLQKNGELFESFRLMEALFERADSVCLRDETTYLFYSAGSEYFRLNYVEPFLVSDNGDLIDTLFKNIYAIQPVEIPDKPGCVDTLLLSLQGKKNPLLLRFALHPGKRPKLLPLEHRKDEFDVKNNLKYEDILSK